ncbi:hypothetical protein L4C34_04280 [Vibrio profundum]|uniref:hypothetical protein n=1 Tax=Vibrio profundum TaxID=2910247 RepID=UPI003D0D7E7F
MTNSLSVIEYFTLFRDREVTIVVDDVSYMKTLKSYRFNVVHYDNYDFSSYENIYLLITSFSYLEKIKNLWGNTNSIICILSIVKFLPSIKNIEYTFNHLLSANIPEILNIRGDAYEFVENNSRLDVKDSLNDFNVSFYNEIDVGNHDLNMHRGFLYSVPEFFEASFVNMNEKCSGYNINGIFSFDGIMTAAVNREVRENLDKKITTICEKVNNSTSKKLIIDNNRITSLVLNGKESTLLDMFEFELGREISEFAFGCNKNIINPDWSINSVSNEGIYGTHIGLGLGDIAPHIDFISKDLMPIY